MLWSGWRVTLYKESNGPFDLRSSNTREYSEIESHQASHEVVSPSHARMRAPACRLLVVVVQYIHTNILTTVRMYIRVLRTVGIIPTIQYLLYSLSYVL